MIKDNIYDLLKQDEYKYATFYGTVFPIQWKLMNFFDVDISETTKTLAQMTYLVFLSVIALSIK